MSNLSSVFPIDFNADDYAAPVKREQYRSEAEILAGFSDAIRAAGLTPPDQIEPTGKLHRFSTDGKPRNRDGWYVLHLDGVPAGSFGCWRADISRPWCAKTTNEMTQAERDAHQRRVKQMQAARDAEREREQQQASKQAAQRWEAATPADDHPYLERKGIKAHATRVDGNLLLVPMRDADGELHSLQTIDPDGAKRFLAGGRKKGCFCLLGEISDAAPLVICEGFATGASIHEATGHPVAVAFDAGNLEPVAKAVKAKYRDAALILAADDDWRTEGNPGTTKATEAARAVGARLMVPSFTSDRGEKDTDFNDLHQLAGLEAVRRIFGQREELPLGIVFADELPKEYEAPDELVEGVLTTGAGSILYGDSNSGKTFFVIDMACAIARGINWMGRRVEQGLVVYIACESPASVKSRLQAYQIHHDVKVPNFAIVQAPINLHSNEVDTEAFIQAVKAVERRAGKPARLVVGDTLARLSAGANENSGEDMGCVIERFDRIRAETNAHFILIHHSGKDAAKGARGWSGIRAAVDTEIEVTESRDDRCAEITKQRDLGTKGERIGFELKPVNVGVTKWGKDATSCVVAPIDAPEQKTEKKGCKLAVHIQTFEKAWFASGAEVRSGNPYLSRADFLKYLTNGQGLTEGSAKIYVRPSSDGKPIHDLLQAGVIAAEQEDGWTVIDDTLCSSLMLRK